MIGVCVRRHCLCEVGIFFRDIHKVVNDLPIVLKVRRHTCRESTYLVSQLLQLRSSIFITEELGGDFAQEDITDVGSRMAR